MRTITLFLTVLLLNACDALSSQATQLSIRLDANPKVAEVGDTVRFVVSATATNISGIVINYGDSTSDQYVTGGGASAQVTFKHVYSATGNFMSRATVTDAVAGDREVSQLIVVNPDTSTAAAGRS